MATKEIKFNIVEKCGVISTSEKGWSKELNRISWNGASPKYDIREWSEDHTKMSKGITLTDAEMENLINIITSD